MFYFRLALALGYAHPDKLLDELTTEQITEWVAFNELEPVGEFRADYRFSMLASVFTNLFMRAFGKPGQKLTTPNDFRMFWDADENLANEQQKQTPEQIRQFFVQLAKTVNQNQKPRNTKK